MKIPDGTAAVNAEAVLVDESQSLGNWEDRVQAVGDFSIGVSQKTYKRISSSMEMEGQTYFAGIRLYNQP